MWAHKLAWQNTQVARYTAYDSKDPVMSHEISISDQRASTGQIGIDVYNIKDGEIDMDADSPAVVIEVQNLSSILQAEKIGVTRDIDVPVFHLHFDNSSLAASFYHDNLGGGRSRFLMRLEARSFIRTINDRNLFEIISE